MSFLTSIADIVARQTGGIPEVGDDGYYSAPDHPYGYLRSVEVSADGVVLWSADYSRAWRPPSGWRRAIAPPPEPLYQLPRVSVADWYRMTTPPGYHCDHVEADQLG